jgi:predicted dehydrogenase
VLGYAGAGVVIDAHPSVPDVQVGERVAYGGEGTGHSEIVLAGRNLVARVPDAVPLDHACFATLGSIALHAVRVAGIGIGDIVAVIGLGLVGQLIAQIVKVQGGVVVGIDLKPERMELARRLGADVIGADSPREAVLAATAGRGADVVIVAAAAKSAEPARQALSICRDRGRLIIVGAVEVNLPWNEMYLKEIQLFMSRAYGPGSYDPSYEAKGQDYPVSYVRWTENRNMEEFLRLCASNSVTIEPLISHRFSLADAPAAYDTIMTPDVRSLAVILRYPAAEHGAAPPAGEAVPPQRRVQTASTKPGGFGIALVGASNIAKWAHLPNLRRAEGAYLRAVVSASGARGKTYAERFGANYCCSDLGEALADPDVDAVIITSRNQHHARETIAALRAGKHVFVEKPMALTEHECREIAQTANESGKVVFVGFNRRFAPFYVEMKRSLRGRQSPAVINCRVNSPGISGSFWMADPAVGGAVIGEACHFVDLMYWLLESEPVLVQAWTLPAEMKEPIGENNIVASFRFADGSIGNLTYCTVGSKASAGERVELFVPGLGVSTEDFKRLSTKRRVERKRSSWLPQKGYDGQMAAFLAAIRQQNTPEVTLRDGARATIGCVRLLESARTGQPASVDIDRVLTGTA